MQRFKLSLNTIVLVILTTANSVFAQSDYTGSRQSIIAATEEVSMLAEELQDRMARAFPFPASWQCAPDTYRPKGYVGPATALATLRLTCQHGEQSLSLFLMVDPPAADTLCRVIDNTQHGISQGTVKPALFRFFENDTWRIMRGSVDLTGCTRSGVAFKASGNRSEAALAEGREPIDRFAEAMLEMDVSELAGPGLPDRYSAAVQALVGELEAQSERLAALIPHPDRIDQDRLTIIRQTLPSGGLFPVSMFVGGAPAASAELEVEGCKVQMSLDASAVAIHEAKQTGLRWASYGGVDGKLRHAWIMRNTERFIGQQSTDGNNVNALIESRVILKVFAKETESCTDPGGIVMPIVDEIMAHDLSELGVN